ncbi:hypothetical protein [Streptomyces sp. NPDC000410]|uniref:hypothetical protein n=1 Tax=Streptomyces sp. NPDC000410 TaxID=3154254 RepID=UPI003329581F
MSTARDEEDTVAVRDAMERTTADLPALPDLASAAVEHGMRRRARARVAVAASVAGVATLGMLAVAALPGGGGGGAVSPAAVGSSPSPTPAPYITPVHVKPSPGEESMADLPKGERKRLEDFQQQAAVALNRTLGDAVGKIRPLDLSVSQFQAEKAGKKFPLTFSVRPQDEPGKPGTPECRDIPSKGMSCEWAELADGIKARVVDTPMNSSDTLGASVLFSYGRSSVVLSVSPDDAAAASAPVTGKQLLAAARDKALLDLVRSADKHPVQEKQRYAPAGD